MAVNNETTPLLRNKPASVSDADTDADVDARVEERVSRWPKWLANALDVENRILLTGFLITLSFSYTQVPMLYVFRQMECDTFYDSHPPYNGTGDRCSRDEIAAGTATQFSILGMTTTFCGIVNLFISGWMVKKFGARTALLAQTIVPAIRVLAQIIGVVAGRRAGINIIQSTQIITVFGGPVGYVLIINIIAGELVSPWRRTIVFGKLQGALMMGQSIGFLAGGYIGDAIEIRAPFDAAFVSFLIAGTFARLALPYIPPTANKHKPGQNGISGFLAPLKILAPQRIRHASGKLSKHYGVIFLCAGIFTGVLATDYAPLLIQLYATTAFDFNQADNGILMSEFAFARSIFLMLMFPRIISIGRKLMTKPYSDNSGSDTEPDGTVTPDTLPTDPRGFSAATGGAGSVREPEDPKRQPRNERNSAHFDLVFLRCSLVVDGALTTISAFATEPWHIYLAAGLLPLGSGSAAAAKGVITSMCTDSQRADALNAVTFVESTARLATQGLFGFMFASLASVGKAYATFFCNAAIAIVGMSVLLFSRFPAEGSTLLDESDLQEIEEREDESR